MPAGRGLRGCGGAEGLQLRAGSGAGKRRDPAGLHELIRRDREGCAARPRASAPATPPARPTHEPRTAGHCCPSPLPAALRDTATPIRLHGHPRNHGRCPHDGLGGWARVARSLPTPVLALVPSFPDPATFQSWSGEGHGAPATAPSSCPELQLWDVGGGLSFFHSCLQRCCSLYRAPLPHFKPPSMPAVCLPSCSSSRHVAQETP